MSAIAPPPAASGMLLPPAMPPPVLAPPDGTGEPDAATAGAGGLGVRGTDTTGTVVDELGAGAVGLDGTGLGMCRLDGNGVGVWHGLVGVGVGVGLQHFFLWL